MIRLLQKTLLGIIILIFMLPALHVAKAEESNSEKAGDILQILIPATAYGTTFYLDDKEGRR